MRRELGLADHKALCELLLQMHAESGMAKFPVALDRSRFVLRHMLVSEAPSVYRMGLVDETGLYGVLLAEVTSHLFVDMLQAKDLFLYVAPAKRGNAGEIRGLLRDYERWAKTQKAAVVCIEVSAGISNEATCGLLKLLGYGDTGRLMVKEII